VDLPTFFYLGHTENPDDDDDDYDDDDECVYEWMGDRDREWMNEWMNEWMHEWMNAWMNDIKLTVWTTAAEAVVWLDWEDAVERSDVFWAQRTIRATAPAHELHWNITFTIHSKTTS